ncbi:MAG: hypothetical protein WAK55_24160 [Xanthobacteraceae bacterium]
MITARRINGDGPLSRSIPARMVWKQVKKALVEPTPSRMDQVSMIECGCCPYADNAITPRRSQSAGQNMRNAANCVEMAKEFFKPEGKLVLLNMAQAWLRLADLTEKFGDTIDSEQQS